MNMNEIGDFQGLVGRVDGLEGRIAELEKTFAATSASAPEPAVTPKPEAAPEPEALPEPEVVPPLNLVTPPSVKKQQNAIPDMTIQLSDVKPKEKAPADTSLEERIGLYWLSKLGIGFLVVGVALLIGYSFKNFGPSAKIATGFIVSSLLMAAGEWMEKRDKIPWYARLLEGGAWATGYFTTYAMYHVQSVKLIQDPLTDLILLMGVAGLAVAHAVNKRSQVMAIYAVTLGFLTLTLSHLTMFSSLAAALLVAMAAVLAVRQKWYQLFLYSVFASYAAFLANGSLSFSLHVTPAWAPSESPEQAFQKICLTLATSLVGFGLVPLFLVPKEKHQERILVVGTVINAGAFCAFFFSRAYEYFGTAASIYNLAMAAWFCVMALLSRRAGNSACARINSLFALTIGTFYFAGAKVGRTSWLYMSFEVAMLAWAGLRFEIRSFRWFALALALVVTVGTMVTMGSADTMTILGGLLPFSLVAGLCAIAAIGGASFFQKQKSLELNASPRERNFAFYIFFSMALLLAWLLPLPMISVSFGALGAMPEVYRTPLLLTSWTLVAACVLALAVKLQSKYMVVLTIFILALNGIPAVYREHFAWINSVDAVIAMFGAAFVLRHYASRWSETASPSLIPFRVQFLIAFFWLGLLPCGDAWSGEKMAVYWAVQGLLVLLVGIKLKDLFLRMITPFSLSLVAIAVSSNPLDWWFVLPVVACYYGSWALYRFGDKDAFKQGETAIRHLYSCSAAIILLCLFGQKLERTWISCAWAIQGFVTLAVGFMLREKQMRVTGLFVFAALVVRLFFVDLAGAETIYRIFAFIVAGLILLISAYAYSLFAKKFDLSANADENRTDSSDSSDCSAESSPT